MVYSAAFNFKINHKILSKLVAIGNFDGSNYALACATVGGKVFIHTPGGLNRSGGTDTASSEVPSSEVNVLNINQAIKCLAAGKLDPNSDRDLLFIGTQTHIQVYDVYNNADVLFQQVTEGVDGCCVGKVGRCPETLALVGGQCTLLGLNSNGDEVFWTITGDSITCMVLCPVLQNGRNQLIVGSEDYDIRIFEDDEIVMEMKETAVVSGLTYISGSRFGYSLENGTVGVYEKNTRLWRIKSKNLALSLVAYDLNGDGQLELIAGWTSGKVDARDSQSGEVIFKDNMPHACAGVAVGAYSGSGQVELLCCSVEGEIRGYLPSQLGQRILLAGNAGQEQVRNLQQKKQNMELELRNLELSRQTAAKIKSGDFTANDVGAIPTDTEVRADLRPKDSDNPEVPPCVQLVVETNNDTAVRAVIVFAEGIFPGESHVAHPNDHKSGGNTGAVVVPLRPPTNAVVDLHLKVFVGYNNSSQLHVFELSKQLPKFSMFVSHPEPLPPSEVPPCYVSFVINERINRIFMWLNMCFLLDEKPREDSAEMNLSFTYLRTNSLLSITCMPQRMAASDGPPPPFLGGSSANNRGKLTRQGSDNSSCSVWKVTFRTDDIELAGDLVQSLFEFIAITEVQCEAHYPHVLYNLKHLLKQVDDLYEGRSRLSAEVADNSNLIRSMIVKAEDSRLLGDWKGMKAAYSQLYTTNQGLVSSYNMRCQNQSDLMATLKLVNQIIQRTANLRVGAEKSKVVEAGRLAIKESKLASFEHYLIAR